MTAGADGTTIDGMVTKEVGGCLSSKTEVTNLSLQEEYIAKKKNSSKKTSSGYSGQGDDKLVQEVVKMILESIYEPVFSNKSHGSRPNKAVRQH